MKNFVSPSVLAADKNKILDEIESINNSGAEYIHFDVMDGMFVPNTSFSFDEVKLMIDHSKLINDVHIMVSDPKKLAKEYFDIGADIVTFHYEAVECPVCVKKISDYGHSLNKKVGISIKPKTNVKKIIPLLDKVDLILIMSVEPGAGGQKFINSSLKKVKFLRKYIDKNNLSILIEIDGGINDVIAKKCRKAGADILVSGTYIFSNANRIEAVESLR